MPEVFPFFPEGYISRLYSQIGHLFISSLPLDTLPHSPLRMVVTKQVSSQLEWLSTLSTSFNAMDDDEKYLRKVSGRVMTVGIRWGLLALGKEDGLVRRAVRTGWRGPKQVASRGTLSGLGVPRDLEYAGPRVAMQMHSVTRWQTMGRSSTRTHTHAVLPFCLASRRMMLPIPCGCQGRHARFSSAPSSDLQPGHLFTMMLIYHIDQHHCHHWSQDQHCRKAVSAAGCRYEHW